MTEYDPSKIKRVVLYLTESQFQTLWLLASRRNCREHWRGKVSVSKFIRDMGDGKFRVVKR